MGIRFRMQGKFGYDGAVSCYFLKQMPVFRRVNPFQPTSQNGDRPSPAGKGAPVGRPDLFEDERALRIFPGLELLEPIMAEIEPDFFVGNFRGEEFDREWNAQTDLLLLDKISVEEAVDAMQKNCQAVLDKEPA